MDFFKQSFGFSLMQLNGELALADNSNAFGNYLSSYYDYYLLYLVASVIILDLSTMTSLE